MSYAREDIEFVRRLNERMREAGRTSYVDFSDVPQWSEDWQRDLYDQIDPSDNVVLVLSPDSIASANVAREIDRTYVVRLDVRDHQSDPLRAELPLILAADRFALAFDGPPDDDQPLIWVAAPAARECVFEVLSAVGIA